MYIYDNTIITSIQRPVWELMNFSLILFIVFSVADTNLYDQKCAFQPSQSTKPAFSVLRGSSSKTTFGVGSGLICVASA